jgi:hypothetical protein
MKKQLLLVVMAVLCLLPKGVQAQTQPDPTLTQNLKKYWENRDRFRKFFVKIGDEQGNSIPCAKRSRWDNSHLMRWGDATTQLGWYSFSAYCTFSLSNRSFSSSTNSIKICSFISNAVEIANNVFSVGLFKPCSKSCIYSFVTSANSANALCEYFFSTRKFFMTLPNASDEVCIQL